MILLDSIQLNSMPVSPNVLMMHRSLSLRVANLGFKLSDSENRCEDDADVVNWFDILWRIFSHLATLHERDGRTDRQTTGDSKE